MKRKQITAMLLAGIMVIGGLSGCGKDNSGETATGPDRESTTAAQTTAGTSAADTASTETQSGTEGETTQNGGNESESTGLAGVFPLSEELTIDMWAFQPTGTDIHENAGWKEMKRLTNINWDVTTATSSDYVEKRNLGLGSGDYQSVYWKPGISEPDAVKYAEEGILIPLNDLIDQYMPNLKAVLDRYNVWPYITSDDGNIYTLPQVDNPGYGTLFLFINKPWLDKLGMEVPSTMEGYLDALRAFKTQDPNGNGKADETPLYLGPGTIPYLMPNFGMAVDHSTLFMYEEDGPVQYPTSEKYKEFLRNVRTLKEENLINDYITADWSELNALGMTQDVVGSFLQYGAHLAVGTEKYKDWVAVVPFEEKSMPYYNGIQYGGLMITDKCKNPELVCQWADYLYSEEGARLADLGIENVTWKMNDDGKTWTKILDSEYGADQQNIVLGGHLPAPKTFSVLGSEGITDQAEIWNRQQKEVVLQAVADPFPNPRWTTEELKRRSVLLADIGTVINEFQANVIEGKTDVDKEWDNYVATLKKMGLDELYEIDKAAVERFNQLKK